MRQLKPILLRFQESTPSHDVYSAKGSDGSTVLVIISGSDREQFFRPEELTELSSFVLSKRIEEFRRRKGLSQKELADACGLDQSEISKIEKR